MEQHNPVAVICIVSLCYCECFSFVGCNRFEVTLEKSNKNFSKKIQQVGGDGGCYIYI